MGNEALAHVGRSLPVVRRIGIENNMLAAVGYYTRPAVADDSTRDEWIEE